MKVLSLVLAILATASVASAYNYLWTGAVDNNWATPGNWSCADPNAPAGPPTGTPDWANQIVTGDDATIDAGNIVIGNGVTAQFRDLYGPAYNSGSGSITVEANGTLYFAFSRFGYNGVSASLVQNGGLVKTVWVVNMPRALASTATATYTMNAGTAEIAQLNLNKDSAGSSLYIAPGAVFKEMGSNGYVTSSQKWTDYIAAGKVTTAPGYTLSIVTLTGQGIFGTDALQILPVPEPATLALLALGGLAALRRRR